MKNTNYRLLLLILSAGSSLLGCGGGGGGTSGSTATPTSSIISGQVVLPPGIPPSSPNGLQQVTTSGLEGRSGTRANFPPNGTAVELWRVDSLGRLSLVLANASIDQGSFSFNLTKLGLAIGNDLILRVSNAQAGTEMRAFAVDSVVDISADSEVTVRLVLEQVGDGSVKTLQNFTTQELNDLQNSVYSLPSNDVSTSLFLSDHIAKRKMEVQGQSILQQFFSSASEPGQTNASPGDVGNYFPLKPLSTYRYLSPTTSASTAPQKYSRYYTKEVLVGGTQTVEVIERSGTKSYLTKDPSGVYLVATGGFDGAIKSLAGRFPILKFPVRKGEVFYQATQMTSIDRDFDGDGIREKVEVQTTIKVADREMVQVSGRELERCWKIVANAESKLTLSRSREIATARVVQSDWYAAEIGLVRETVSAATEFRGKREETIDTINLGGVGFITEIDASANDLAYDARNQKLLASLSSMANAGTNGIAVIDLASETIDKVVPIFSGEPKRVVLSGDAKIAYVAVHASQGYIQKYDTSSYSLLSEFSMAKARSNSVLFPFDISVNPQDSD